MNLSSLFAGVALNSVGAFRNKIHNPCGQIAQRTTSGTVGQTSSGYCSVDRWKLWNNHDAGNISLIQETSVVPHANVRTAIKVTNAAGNDTTIAAGQYCLLDQTVEGYDLVPLLGKTCTLSFWVRSSKTGTYCVCLESGGDDRCMVKTYSISAANTWEKKTITIDMAGATTAGTWYYTTGAGLKVRFVLACGADYQITADTWQSADAFSTSAQVNFLNETNTFYLTEVQLEAGSTAFEERPYPVELAICQRYYCMGTFWIPASTDKQGYPIAMRAAPTPSGGGSGFSSTGTTADMLIVTQTSGAATQLELAADL